MVSIKVRSKYHQFRRCQPLLKKFSLVANLARTNSINLNNSDLILGVLYGEESQLSQHYKKIDEQHPVIIGQNLWDRLTGYKYFYVKLISQLDHMIINFLPVMLAFFPEKISKAYGIELPNTNYELLLRHRAIMLGLVGALMIFAAISKKYHSISVTIGLISMVSFIVLYFMINGINIELGKVMKMDIIAIALLSIGFLCYSLKG